MEINYSPYVGLKGDIEGFVVNARNVTDRHEAEQALAMKVSELQEFNDLAIGRELRMIELKREINALLESKGEHPRYEVD